MGRIAKLDPLNSEQLRSVVFLDELPRNVMGKVLKRDLRAGFGYPVGGE